MIRPSVAHKMMDEARKLGFEFAEGKDLEDLTKALNDEKLEYLLQFLFKELAKQDSVSLLTTEDADTLAKHTGLPKERQDVANFMACYQQILRDEKLSVLHDSDPSAELK